MFCNNCSSDRLILIKIFYCWHTNLLPEFHKNVLWRDIGLLVTEIFGQRALTKTTQDNIMCASNLRHIHIFTNVLKFGCYDTNLFSLGQARFWCFPFVHHVLTDSCLMFTEFSSTSNWKRTSQSPVSKCWTLLWSKFLFPYYFFFSFDWVKLKIIFGIALFSPREKNREGNHLWQWIIENFILVRPYKLCTKRAKKE